MIIKALEYATKNTPETGEIELEVFERILKDGSTDYAKSPGCLNVTIDENILLSIPIHRNADKQCLVIKYSYYMCLNKDSILTYLPTFSEQKKYVTSDELEYDSKKNTILNWEKVIFEVMEIGKIRKETPEKFYSMENINMGYISEIKLNPILSHSELSNLALKFLEIITPPANG